MADERDEDWLKDEVDVNETGEHVAKSDTDDARTHMYGEEEDT